MSLADLAIEILNEAKVSGDVKEKLYKLEQVKEIVFHRDEAVLEIILPDIQSFMLEKAIPIRKFLLSFIVECCTKNHRYFDNLIPLCHHLYNDDRSNESISFAIANTMIRFYAEIAIYIVRKPPAEGQLLWSDFSSVCQKLLEGIASTSSDNLRAQYLRFSEEYVLFGLAPPPASADPRLARVIKKPNATDIPFHHLVVNAKTLEQDSDSFFNKLLLWVSKNGPQGFPFSPTLTVQLISSISFIATQRSVKVANSVKALNAFMKDKTSLYQSLDVESKETLLRTLQKLLPAALSNKDLSEIASRMHEYIENFALHIVETRSVDAATNQSHKRKAESLNSVDVAEDGGGVSMDMTASVKAAVDAAATEHKSARPVAAAVASTATSTVPGGELELCSDLMAAPAGSYKEPLTKVSFREEGLLVKADAVISAVQKPPAVHDELSFQALRRLLDSATSAIGADSQLTLAKVCTRVVLLMAYADIEASRSALVIHLLLAGANNKIDIPADVKLPRSIWVTVSYCLGKADAGPVVKDTKGAQKKTPSCPIELLAVLFSELSERGKQFRNDADLQSLYEATLLATLCRCIEKRHLRVLLKQLLLGVPFIPHRCIHLLGYMAMKSSGADTVGDKSLSKELLALLCDVAIGSASRTSRESSLKTLLWFCVAEEFDIRVKAISFLSTELTDKSEAITYMILSFAKQAVISLFGAEVILESEVVAKATATAVIGEDRMETDEAVEVEETIYEAARWYDRGKSFGGTFSSTWPSDPKEHIKRHMHLATQVALRNPTLLKFLVDIYAINESLQLKEPAPASEGGGEPSPAQVKLDAMRTIITAEIANIVPVVLQSFSAEELFDMLSSTDALANPLLVEILHMMFKEDRIPPSMSMVKKVQAFAATLDESLRRRAFIPIIGGLSTAEVEELIKAFVKTLGMTADGLVELDKIFCRIHRTRPPPLNKAALLVYLHRIELDKDQKAVLDSIELCLKNKSEFKSDVLKEAINALLEDAVPVLPLMRTAIRSAQALVDMRPFVLNEVIPKLLLKEVWTASPRVWEGVVLASKILIEQREGELNSKGFEPLLKALLKVPVKPLGTLLGVTPKLKTNLRVFLAALNDEEKLAAVGGDEELVAEKLNLF